MILRASLLLMSLVLIASCQTTAPRGFVWDYDHAANGPAYQDSIQFKLYYGQSAQDTLFMLLDSTEALDIDIRSHRWLYSNQDRWFYLIAESMRDKATSLSSNIVQIYFPKIINQDPVNFEAVKFKF